MKAFKHYLNSIGEVGYVEQVKHALVYVSGLPNAKPEEVVIFEPGQIGKVLSLSKNTVEVLMLSSKAVKIGTEAARTDSILKLDLKKDLLGKVINPLGSLLDSTEAKLILDAEDEEVNGNEFSKDIESPPLPINYRKKYR